MTVRLASGSVCALLILCLACTAPCAANLGGFDGPYDAERDIGPHQEEGLCPPATMSFAPVKRYVIVTPLAGINRSRSAAPGSGTGTGVAEGRGDPINRTARFVRWYPPPRSFIRTVTTTATPGAPVAPSSPAPAVPARPGLSQGVEAEPGLFRFAAADVQAIRNATPDEVRAGGSHIVEDRWETTAVDPMEILSNFPRLRLESGYRLGAFVACHSLAWYHWVFAVPVDAPAPRPSERSSRDPWADPDYMRYIDGDGTPAAYLEATVFRMQAESFGEYWHTTFWKNMAVLDAPPAAYGSYRALAPAPAVWSPTVRVTGGQVEVTLFMFSDDTPESSGVWRVTETFTPGSYHGERTLTRIAEVPFTIIY